MLSKLSHRLTLLTLHLSADRHKFHYLRDQTPAEVLLLRCFDSTLGAFLAGLRRLSC